MTHNPKNFASPDKFIPERWLDPNCTENLDASKPFLTGPRAYMGQNMAWIELRISIAEIVLLFDFEMDDKTLDWSKQECYTLWQKPELLVEVLPRNLE